MATRSEVLAAYATNPKASFSPTEDAIAFWQDKGLGNFNQIVDEARAQNPALAAQIDTERAAANRAITGGGAAVTGGGGNVVTGGGGNVVTGGGAVDNSALYRNLVTQAYGGIGRKGIGTDVKNIDQGGYDFFLNALQNGTLTPDNFQSSFNRIVGQYVTENPTNALTQAVQAYKPFQNTGLLSQSQLQPQSMGAQPVTNYQPQSLAQNFENYMGIPIGAQYNPAVTSGGASPYSQIRAISPQFVNPYAGTVANTAMGGYNPMLYENVKAADKAAAANVQVETPYAKGGMVNSLSGSNPVGPDDGMAALELGEYVIKKSSVDKYGKGLLDMINEGKVPVKKAKSLLF